MFEAMIVQFGVLFVLSAVGSIVAGAGSALAKRRGALVHTAGIALVVIGILVVFGGVASSVHALDTFVMPATDRSTMKMFFVGFALFVALIVLGTLRSARAQKTATPGTN